jgi:hypothetical protein
MGTGGKRINRRNRIGGDMSVAPKVSPLKLNTFQMNSIDGSKPST